MSATPRLRNLALENAAELERNLSSFPQCPLAFSPGPYEEEECPYSTPHSKDMNLPLGRDQINTRKEARSYCVHSLMKGAQSLLSLFSPLEKLQQKISPLEKLQQILEWLFCQITQCCNVSCRVPLQWLWHEREDPPGMWQIQLFAAELCEWVRGQRRNLLESTTLHNFNVGIVCSFLLHFHFISTRLKWAVNATFSSDFPFLQSIFLVLSHFHTKKKAETIM